MKTWKDFRPGFVVLTLMGILGCTNLHADGGGENLVVNPDFESMLPGQHAAGWHTWQKVDGTVFRVVTDQNVARAGSKCVAMEQGTASQRNYAVWFQEIPAKHGTTYRYSFWIKTDRVHPLTAYSEDWAASCGTVDFLDSNRKELQSEPQFARSASVFMTHDWKKLEISFTTPKETAYIKVNLALGNAVGTVFFDSVSLAVSPFREALSPAWLRDAVVYELGPWEFSQFGDGKAFKGIIRKLPELETLGVTLLYLLPVWDDSGWYRITDHFSLFRKYGTEKELKALIDDAHRRGMKVILDLVASGVPLESKLVREHPQWFIHGGDDKLYRSWMDLYGLDTNHPDVQQYFADFAKYYVARLDVDGYRCDLAMMMHYEMFEKIRNAIRQIKPDAILIAEGNAPVDHETAFDATYDFPFLERISLLISSPHNAGITVRWLETQSGFYPPGALHLRYLEGHDLTFTVSSKCGLTGSKAFATFLLTIDGIPMIYNGHLASRRSWRSSISRIRFSKRGWISWQQCQGQQAVEA